MLLDPDNETVISAAANALYQAGRIEEALPLFERLRDFQPEGRPIDSSNDMMMRLALARRETGDEEGAQTALQIAKHDHAALLAVGARNQFHKRTEASIAAFEQNSDRTIAALKSAMQMGLRDSNVFSDPMFEAFWEDPRFVALQQELDAILLKERANVIQLICFNNPAPTGWQPLPETCEGAVNRQVL
jgi:hypothetical protein